MPQTFARRLGLHNRDGCTPAPPRVPSSIPWLTAWQMSLSLDHKAALRALKRTSTATPARCVGASARRLTNPVAVAIQLPRFAARTARPLNIEWPCNLDWAQPDLCSNTKEPTGVFSMRFAKNILTNIFWCEFPPGRPPEIYCLFGRPKPLRREHPTPRVVRGLRPRTPKTGRSDRPGNNRNSAAKSLEKTHD